MGKIFVRGILSVVFVGLFTSACSKSGSDVRFGIDPGIGLHAAPDISQSFSVKGSELSIFKEALNKEFLFQVQGIRVSNANQFNGLKSRVVYFIQKDKKVFMLQATQGHKLSEDYDPKLILASFNVLTDDGVKVSFDLNAGLSRLYVKGEWYASDDEGKDYDPTESSAHVSQSYLEKLNLENKKNLVIKQVAQLDNANGETMSVAVQYYLTPYEPNPNFVPKNDYSFDRFGYFETAPILKLGGETLVRASKFDSKKPIVYAISDNTPEDYKEAIRAGVRYWNRILGENRVQVIDAPKGVSAPDFNYNVIQWVNWENAGFAYADAQMDPRSGEILHAQIFMTSAFSFNGRARLRTILRKIKTAPKSTKQINIKGFENMPGCDVLDDEHMEKNFEQLLAMDLTDDQIKKYSQEYVTQVITHEIGHTLGLRHNFAGSVSASYNSSEIEDIFEQYTKTGESDAVPSSSVMDYLNLRDSVILGHNIQIAKATLDYDNKAIQHLYFDQKYENKDIPPFCTDTQVGSFADCYRFDTGKSFVDDAKTQLASNLSALPNLMLDRFILYKTNLDKEEQDSGDIMEMVAPPKVIAFVYVSSQTNLLGMLRKSFQILKIQRQHSYVSDINHDEILKEQDDYVSSEISRLGGLEAVLNPFEQNKDQFVAGMVTRLNELIDSKVYSQGVGSKDHEFVLSADELNLLKNISQSYFAKIYDEVKKQQLRVWTGFLGKQVRDTDISKLTAKFLLDQSKEIILSQTSKKNDVKVVVSEKPKPTINEVDQALKDIKNTNAKKEEKKPVISAVDDDDLPDVSVAVSLPEFQYPFETRLLATALLKTTPPTAKSSAEEVENISFGYAERYDLKTSYQRMMKPVNLSLKDKIFHVEKQEPAVMKWFLEQQKINESL